MYTLDSTYGLYAAADTAEQAVTVLRAHLHDQLGNDQLTYLVTGPGGQKAQGTVVAWSTYPDEAADAIEWLLATVTESLHAAAAGR